MTTDPAAMPPPGKRDPGDAWVVADTGERYWGRFGAAGLLAFDSERGVLLQHRAAWSHHGDTWGIPGGALHEGEAAVDGALREAYEEAGVPPDAVRLRLIRTVDLAVWSYTTVVADVVEAFEPVAGDQESVDLRWVPLHEVDSLPLHPAFSTSWPSLQRSLGTRPCLVVDAANVVGSTPDGWWHDRKGATERLAVRLSALANHGVPGAVIGFEGERWHVPIDMVVEGAARGVRSSPEVVVLDAPGSGDDAIVERVALLSARGMAPIVITSDRELQSRSERAGASVHGAGWLLDLLDRLPAAGA